MLCKPTFVLVSIMVRRVFPTKPRNFNNQQKKFTTYWCKTCSCFKCKKARNEYYSKKDKKSYSKNKKFNAINVDWDVDGCPYLSQELNELSIEETEDVDELEQFIKETRLV